MSAYEQITSVTKNYVTTITLNRPERLNAWTAKMAEEIRDAIGRAGNDKDTRCIIVTGAGRGFCAGADMDSLQGIAGDGENTKVAKNHNDVDFTDAPGPDLTQNYSGNFAYLYSCPKPIIALINGPCAGIGLVFALYADLRYIDENAKLTTAFAARGLIAEHGIAWLLPRLIGEAKALDLLLSARKFTGKEAAEMAMVNKALPAEQLQEHVNSVANTLANTVSPRSMSIMKRQVRASYYQSFTESLTIADTAMNASFSTFDFNEGVKSFVEKRAPNFENL